MTYGREPTEQGILLDDIWDEAALRGFDPALVASTQHCPLLTTQEGYSHDLSLLPNVETL